MAKGTILIVEDEENIRDLVAAYLERAGFDVVAAVDGETALRLAEQTDPVLVVLDLMLPGIDGLEVCRRLRRESDVPILMLTARTEERDKLVGLGLGADDYVTKPFSPREMVARVRTILRRAGPGQRPAEGQILTQGGLEMDIVRRTVAVDGRPVNLSLREFELLHTLLDHPGRVFSRQELLDRCWGLDFAGVDRVVDVHVSNLRAKLGDDPASPRFIKTVRGVGYRLCSKGVEGLGEER
jgi:two-component system alkaline phosphatase synthesis response regulator PhoP